MESAPFQKIVEQSLNPVVIFDRKGIISFWNKAAENFFHVSEEEAIFSSIFKFLPGLANESLTNSKTWELEALIRSGAALPVRLQLIPLGDADSGEFAVVLTDLSVERHLEAQSEEIQDFQNAFLTAQGDLGEGFVIMDTIQKRILYASPSLEKILGYSSEELKAQTNVFSYVPEEYRPMAEFRAQKRREEGKTQTRQISPIVRKDGTQIFLDVALKDVETSHGLNTIIIVRDITERYLKQEELAEEKRRFQSLAEATSEGICMSEDGIIIEANDQLAKYLGFSKVSEILGHSVLEFAHESSIPLVKENIRKDFRGRYNVVARKRDGTLINVELQGNTIDYKGKKIRVTSFRVPDMQKLALGEPNHPSI